VTKSEAVDMLVKGNVWCREVKSAKSKLVMTLTMTDYSSESFDT
jgi:hypothetical protein